jgi:hypothetical protein
MSEAQTNAESNWFYEENGQRKGPVSEVEMLQLMKSSVVSQGTSVWRQGFPDWLKIENTELSIHFNGSAPPPLSGEHINNTLVWVLAFAPIIGYLLEWMVAGAVHGNNQFAAQLAMANSKYWFITLALNIALAFFDEKRLKIAGHDTKKFKGWVWLVPVYLYQRSKATKQNLAYFIVWIVCFVLVLLG